jgi:hypothetical protein
MMIVPEGNRIVIGGELEKAMPAQGEAAQLILELLVLIPRASITAPLEGAAAMASPTITQKSVPLEAHALASMNADDPAIIALLDHTALSPLAALEIVWACRLIESSSEPRTMTLGNRKKSPGRGKQLWVFMGLLC